MQIPSPSSSPRSTSPSPASSPERSPSPNFFATNNTLSTSPFSETNLPEDLTQTDFKSEGYVYKILEKHEAECLQQLSIEKIYSNLDEVKLREGMQILTSSLASICEYLLEELGDQAESLGRISGQLLIQNLPKENLDKLVVKANNKITGIIDKLSNAKQEQASDSVEEAIDQCINKLIYIFKTLKFSLPSQLIKASLDFINQREKKAQLIQKFFGQQSINDYAGTILLAIERKFYPLEANNKNLEDLLEDPIEPSGNLTNLIGQLEFCITLLALEESSQITGTTAFQAQILGVIKNSLRNSNIIRLANTKSARNT